jgi:hypothetical protein
MLQELIRDTSFGPFYWNGFEFLRRIFVTVRDRNWREISPHQWECSVDEAQSTIEVSARHTSEGIDFAWTGQLRVDPTGCDLSFEFQGQALTTMEVCRLGLVVLHPVHTLTDATVTARSAASANSIVIDRQIAPQPVTNGVPRAITEPFHSLAINHAGFGRLALEFHGELFELEDQRNWGDASFKSYCTPLRRGFPRKVENGSRISHRVDAHFAPSTVVQPQRNQETGLWNSRGCLERALRIGRVVATASESVEHPDWMRGWDHLRVDFDETTETALEGLLQQLPQGTTLHLVSAVEQNSPPSKAIIEFLQAHSDRVSAILLKASESPLPTAKAVAQVRAVLRETPAASIPLLASPNGYFVEFNRGQVFDLDVDGIAFPLSPTVHGQDAQTILENASVVRDMVATARRVSGKSQIHLSPIALALAACENPIQVPRGVTTAWLASVLAQCAEAHVASVTLGPDLL